jgi:hypothetical protein
MFLMLFPRQLETLSATPKRYKVALKHYLLTHSYYNLDEFFSEQNSYVMFDTNYIVQILISLLIIL